MLHCLEYYIYHHKEDGCQNRPDGGTAPFIVMNYCHTCVDCRAGISQWGKGGWPTLLSLSSGVERDVVTG